MRKLFALITGCLCWMAAAAEAAPLSGPALVDALSGGGFIVYFRHAGTDWSQNDQVARDGDWESCDGTRMRQLSDAGRETARDVGRAIRALGIPISDVFSSEYCRARETAELLDLGPVEPTREIMNLRSAEYVGGRDAAAGRLLRYLSSAPPSGTNTVIVAHGNLVRAATGAYPGEAGAVVFRPRPGDLPEVVAEIAASDWRRLAQHHGLFE